MSTVVLLMFVSFVTRQRFYPFTDFYMFSYLRLKPQVCTVGYQDKNGQVHYLKNFLYRPLTRGHIHQMCTAFHFSHNYEWIKIIKERLPYEYQNKKLLIHIVEYDHKLNALHLVKKIYEETL